MINYRSPLSSSNFLADTLRFVIGSFANPFFKNGDVKYTYPAVRFQRKYFQQTKYAHSRDTLTKISEKLDYIVCGSDQIWAPNVFDAIYMADFVDGNHPKKISYAASIGLNAIPEELSRTYRELLRSFHRVSVREEAGSILLRNSCGIDAAVVLDPTLLLSAQSYRSIQRPLNGAKEPYVFCYFLNQDNQYRDTVYQYAKENGYTVIGFSRKAEDAQWMRAVQYIDPSQFLWLIDHAQAVFTDSYHGTIFSLLFHKKFFTFERFEKNDPINQNSRIDQLVAYFGIDRRILNNGKRLADCTPLDFELVEEQLTQLRQLSHKYLLEALE